MIWIRTIAALGGLGSLACATPQTINIKAVPAGAAISVDNEYLGESPASFSMRDVDDFESLRIGAELAGYESAAKTVGKKPGGLFPGQVYLQLESRAGRGEAPVESVRPGGSAWGLRDVPPRRFELDCRLDDVSGEVVR